MNNYPSQTLSPMYPYSIVHQYPPQAYYYSYNEYPSSSLLSPMSYTSLPRDRYSSSVKYYDDETAAAAAAAAYFSEYHHRHHHSHRSNHGQYSNNQRSNRARNISR
jgi:hypothetical protein